MMNFQLYNRNYQTFVIPTQIMFKLIRATSRFKIRHLLKFSFYSNANQRNFSLLNFFTKPFPFPPITSSINEIKPIQHTPKKKKQRYRKRKTSIDPVSAEGILRYELEGFQKQHHLDNNIPDEVIQYYRDSSNHTIIDNLEILEINSNGQGLGIVDCELEDTGSIAVVVPFVTKGDIVQIRLGRHNEKYAEGHLIKVIKASDSRRDDLVKCKNFTSCSGCQLQMLSYEDQLKFKTKTVENAYKRFEFDIGTLPIMPTVGSPQQYGYRTKLTPHFTSNRKNILIGFEKAGMGQGMFDVDSCDIATPILDNALRKDRAVLEDIVRRYKKGGTILLRDTTVEDNAGYTTDHREIVTQRINGFDFQFPAGEFFQNNNSILPPLLETIRGYIDPIRHKVLVDTYCGSGFFGISLSQSIESLIGIEVSKGNLDFAQKNAESNNVQNSKFILGSSEEIFKDLKHVNPNETIVILDPPRKGSTEEYLSQLSEFKPSLIVYISCNVFTQARDLEYFIGSTSNGSQYTIKTVGGYDFFPQTRHVESLAVLELDQCI